MPFGDHPRHLWGPCWDLRDTELGDYWDGYSDGIARATVKYDSMIEEQVRIARAEVFAAIRRAAKVAREYDAIYRQAFVVGDYDTYASTPDGDDVRCAIRHAIESDKA